MISQETKELAEKVYRLIIEFGVELPTLPAATEQDPDVLTVAQACEALGMQRVQLIRLAERAGILNRQTGHDERPYVSRSRRGYTREQIEKMKYFKTTSKPR